MRIVEYIRRLNAYNALRVRFEIERGRITKFVVQLECRYTGDYQPVVRYDTAHGYAHRDLLHPSGEVEKSDLQEDDYNRAFNFAIGDLRRHWREYYRRYEQWLHQEPK